MAFHGKPLTKLTVVDRGLGRPLEQFTCEEEPFCFLSVIGWHMVTRLPPVPPPGSCGMAPEAEAPPRDLSSMWHGVTASHLVAFKKASEKAWVRCTGVLKLGEPIHNRHAPRSEAVTLEAVQCAAWGCAPARMHIITQNVAVGRFKVHQACRGISWAGRLQMQPRRAPIATCKRGTEEIESGADPL